MTFTPTGSLLLVRLTRPVERTAAGIYLPDVAQRRPGEATVLAVGAGRAIPGSDLRAGRWARPGDIVVFKSADFQQCGEDPLEGLVLAEHVVAQVHPETGEIAPEGEHVKIEPDFAAWATPGGVVLPERSREQAKSGVILDYGPGQMLLSGAYFGTRKTICAMMGLAGAGLLIGRTAYWAGEEKSLYLSGSDPCVLVPASDIFALEDD